MATDIRGSSPANTPIPASEQDNNVGAGLLRNTDQVALQKRAEAKQTDKKETSEAKSEAHAEHLSNGGKGSALAALVAKLNVDGLAADDPRVLLAALLKTDGKVAADAGGDTAAALKPFADIALGKRDATASVAEAFAPDALAAPSSWSASLPPDVVDALRTFAKDTESAGANPQAQQDAASKLAGKLGLSGDSTNANYTKMQKLASLVETSFFKAGEMTADQAKDLAPNAFVKILEGKIPELVKIVSSLDDAVKANPDIELPKPALAKIEQVLGGSIGGLAKQVAAANGPELKQALLALRTGGSLKGFSPQTQALAKQVVSYGEARKLESQGILFDDDAGPAIGNSGTGGKTPPATGGNGKPASGPGADIRISLGGNPAIDMDNMDIDALIHWIMLEGARTEEDVLRDQMKEMQKRNNEKKAQREKISAMRTTQTASDAKMHQEFSALQATGKIASTITFEAYQNWRQVGWGDGAIGEDGTFKGPAGTLVPPNWQDLQIPDWMKTGSAAPTGGGTNTADQKAAAPYGVLPEQADMLKQIYDKSPDKAAGKDFATFLGTTLGLKLLADGGNVKENNDKIDAYLGKVTPGGAVGKPSDGALATQTEIAILKLEMAKMMGGDTFDLQKTVNDLLAKCDQPTKDKISAWMKSSDKINLPSRTGANEAPSIVESQGLVAIMKSFKEMFDGIKAVTADISTNMNNTNEGLDAPVVQWDTPWFTFDASGPCLHFRVHDQDGWHPMGIHMPPAANEIEFKNGEDEIHAFLHAQFDMVFDKLNNFAGGKDTAPLLALLKGTPAGLSISPTNDWWDKPTWPGNAAKGIFEAVRQAEDPLAAASGGKPAGKAPPTPTQGDLDNWAFHQKHFDDVVGKNFDANGKFIGDPSKLDPDTRAFYEKLGLITKTPEQVAAEEKKSNDAVELFMKEYGTGHANDPSMMLNHHGTLAQLNAEIDNEKTKLDSMNDMSEMDSLRLQTMMDRRQKLIEAISNIMKKIAQTNDAIVQNMK